MNIAGLIVIGAGLLLIVMALRNTQSQVLPQLFSNTSSSSSSSTGGGGIAGLGCPPGYHPVTVVGIQWCFSNVIPQSGTSQDIIPMPTN